jgi:imidazolonepropionase-like amidohydrolase
LKDAKIPVMLNRIHSLPENETDPVDLPYRLPKLLQDAEVLFCLQPHGDMEAMNARNLPFYAGTAWAYGLTEEQAVASISKNVCEITGTSKNYGTIEEGKSATLFISKGNALDMRTNSVTLAYVNGERIDLLNTQEELYRKYLKKYQN